MSKKVLFSFQTINDQVSSNPVACPDGSDTVIQIVPGEYPDLYIIGKKLILMQDLSLLTLGFLKRVCIFLPYGFLVDAAGNYFPEDPNGFFMLFHTVGAANVDDIFKPKILGTNFEYRKIEDQPLNPLLTFFFSEPVTVNLAGKNVTFSNTADGGSHSFGI